MASAVGPRIAAACAHASLAALSDENGLSASGSIIQIEGSGHGNRLVYFLLIVSNYVFSFNFAIPLYQTMFLVFGFMLMGLLEDISLQSFVLVLGAVE